MQLSERTKKNTKECHYLLQELIHRGQKKIKFEVFCAYRDEYDQNFSFRNNLTKLKYPDSAHNKKPSMAFDAYPIPLDWNNIKRFIMLGKILKECFLEMCKEKELKEVRLIWGGDYKSFKDYVHFELEFYT